MQRKLDQEAEIHAAKQEEVRVHVHVVCTLINPTNTCTCTSTRATCNIVAKDAEYYILHIILYSIYKALCNSLG